MQIVASSLLGLTVQCAKCHDHKFEPLSQRDYYQLQAVFYPAFNVEDWIKPNDRFVYANLPGELEAWEERNTRIDSRDRRRCDADFAAWVREHRPPSTVLFRDEFAEDGPPLADAWSATAPGDDAPGRHARGATRLDRRAGRCAQGGHAARSWKAAEAATAGFRPGNRSTGRPSGKASGSR